MVDPIWDLIPNAEVWHIGMWRDEETLEPVWYYNKLEGTPRIERRSSSIRCWQRAARRWRRLMSSNNGA